MVYFFVSISPPSGLLLIAKHIWLPGIHSQVLQQALKDLDRAYVNFFEKKAGFPKLSMAICQNHAVVVIEDLNVKGMSASASGTTETLGRNVRVNQET